MGENNTKATKVNDPVVRLLMTIATGVAAWSMHQVQAHSETLAAIVKQVQHLEISLANIETRSEKVTDSLHSDIRDIRNIIERKQ